MAHAPHWSRVVVYKKRLDREIWALVAGAQLALHLALSADLSGLRALNKYR
jgi:ABC-type enterobactin transport system permease subunit